MMVRRITVISLLLVGGMHEVMRRREMIQSMERMVVRKVRDQGRMIVRSWMRMQRVVRSWMRIRIISVTTRRRIISRIHMRKRKRRRRKVNGRQRRQHTWREMSKWIGI